MQCAIIFAKPVYGGLRVTHLSTIIYSNMTAQIHYTINCNTDKQCHNTTIERIKSLKMHSKCTQENMGKYTLVKKNRILSYINIAVAHMIKNEITIAENKSTVKQTEENVENKVTINQNVKIFVTSMIDKKSNIAAFAMVGKGENYKKGRIPGLQSKQRADLFGILWGLKTAAKYNSANILSNSKSCVDTIISFQKHTHQEQCTKCLDKDLIATIVKEMRKRPGCTVQWTTQNDSLAKRARELAIRATKHKKVTTFKTITNDRYIVKHNHDVARGNAKEFITEILTHAFNKANTSKYNVTGHHYCTASEIPKEEPANIQTFLTRVRANTLATRSKMQYWFKQDSTCPTCLEDHEDQMHFLMECTGYQLETNEMINNITNIIRTDSKQR
jgi:hypothetical protein